MRVVTDRLSARAVPPGALAAPPAGTPRVDASGEGSRHLAGFAALAGSVLFAATLALSTRTGMWLDEAQTLSISRLPTGDLLDALRADGAPPLYYLLLRGWTALMGTGEAAARSLSAVLAVAAVALAPLAGARLGGRRVALAAGALFATAPFMHRYATEARMYTLVVLLTLAGFVALGAALDRPTIPALAAVGAVTGLLLLTHYWSIFLLAVVAALVARRARTGDTGARRALVAMAVGSLLFLPWAPSFLYQLRHTGAPWGPPAGPWAFEEAVEAFAGGRGRLGFLGLAFLGLVALGLLARPLSPRRLELDLGGRPGARPLALVVAGTLALAVVASQLTGSAFAPRYAAVVLVPFLLLAARGLSVVEHRRALPLLVAAVVGLGMVRSFDEASAPRTQAPRIAAALEAEAQPGDLVAFCPDQLAPAVTRLISSLPVTTAAFPTGGPVERVDWVDYRRRVRATTGRAFAASLDRRAGGSSVWVAWAPGYHNLGRSCEAVLQGMRRLRPSGERRMARQLTAYENASLWRFPPTTEP